MFVQASPAFSARRGPQRTFLMLQGPPGPFFWDLGRALAAAGAIVLRINLNGGDEHDWPGEAVCYRGRRANWTLFVDRFLRDRQVTDLVLFGDCRAMHSAAHGIARLRGVRVHVFEEGYIRPDWLTLERDGVNGHSTLERDPVALLAMARDCPPQAAGGPPIRAAMRRRVRDSWRYFSRMWWGGASLRYPFYRSHRPGSIVCEGLGWVWKYQARHRRAQRVEAALGRISGSRYFLFPLQLSSDFQIRIHSPFSSMVQAVDYVLGSFALHAPPDTRLVVKAHPLDARWGGWERLLRRRARRLGLAGRLIHVDGGDLRELAQASLGMVVVNSTAATFALADGVPVIALGRAIYDIAGLTHQGALDGFWTRPVAPDREIWAAFRRVLEARCLVRGGLASRSALAELVRNAAMRLLASEPLDTNSAPAELPLANIITSVPEYDAGAP